jgi:excinuclease ABC subunit C
VLARALTFSPDPDDSSFQEIPAAAAVFLLSGEGEPYVSKTANLRRRLQRLLGRPTELTRRLNLRDRVREIEFTPTGSDFESQFLLYRLLRKTFPKTYAARLRIRSAPLVKLHLENEYPRASVTTRPGRIVNWEGTAHNRAEQNRIRATRHGSKSCPSRINSAEMSFSSTGKDAGSSKHNVYYGPFPSRAAAEKFASDALDFFKMRRCVDDLHPDPKFPGCVYSEMKMCLAPCFKGCTDAGYHAEVARVRTFFDTGGESLVRELTEQRERASADLAFEEAATIHAKIDKLKPVLSQLPEIVRRVDRLGALIVQPSAEAGAVSMFLFHSCVLEGPIPFSIETGGDSKSMDARVEQAIANFPGREFHSTAERMEHLAILKRWYYRSHRIGEVFFADEKGAWPLRRIVRGIGRVYRGEKAQEPAPFSATPGQSPTSEPA